MTALAITLIVAALLAAGGRVGYSLGRGYKRKTDELFVALVRQECLTQEAHVRADRAIRWAWRYRRELRAQPAYADALDIVVTALEEPRTFDVDSARAYGRVILNQEGARA